MNILFITNSIGYGGAEKSLAFVANGLDARGHRISIANLCGVPKEIGVKTQEFNESINITNVSLKNTGKLKRYSQLKELLKYSRSYKPDIVVGLTAFPNFYSVIIAKIIGAKSIISERGNPFKTFSDTKADRFIINVINHAAGAVFQTEGAAELYSSRLRNKGTIIPNPIFIKDDSLLQGGKAKRRDKTVVSVGRFNIFQKRNDIMLQAFARFHQSHPDYILKLYGSGEDEKVIRNLISDLGLSESVRMMGVSNSPMKDIIDDGVFLITSDYEGIPNSLLEAMAIGMPVVSTDCTPGGARMLIQDHINGLLVPVGDVSAIASALCEFAENSELAQKCGANARDIVRRFDPKDILDQWEHYLIQKCTDK